MRDFELLVKQQRDHDCMLAVSVNTGACVAQSVRIVEKWCALRLFQRASLGRRRLDVIALAITHKQIFGLHSLLLHARWRNVDLVSATRVRKRSGDVKSVYPSLTVIPPPVPVTHPRV